MKTKLIKKIICGVILTSMTAAMFTGCATTDASGFDKSHSVSVVSREDGSGTRGAFTELFEILVKGDDGTKTDTTTKEAIIANKTDVMLTNVSGDEYAIGYVSLGSLSDTVKALKIDGVEATTENVKNSTYKVSRPFIITTNGEVDGIKKDFIDYILSKEGQEVVAASYIAVDDAAAAYAGTKPTGKLIIAGSSSVTPIMEKLKEAYVALNPNADIQIQQFDSTAGITGTIDGTCDIGMSSRDLKDSEKENLVGTTIAIDGIAVIVNTKNPITEATSEQVRNIFTGKTTDWK